MRRGEKKNIHPREINPPSEKLITSVAFNQHQSRVSRAGGRRDTNPGARRA